MEKKVKPCPFCGSDNVELRPGFIHSGAVHCNDCSADVVFNAVSNYLFGADWKTTTTIAWNRRAERSFSPVMPITNADRIRQMSDDELATLFGDACACLYDDADVCEKWGGACDRCWLDWLKQEVDDDRT